MKYPNLSREIRKRGITQKTIANTLNVRETTVSDWLSGRHSMTIETGVEIRDKFLTDMTLDYLFSDATD